MDKRIVMALDAGGTNMVFSAIQDKKEIVPPVILPSEVNDINKCLNMLVNGFEKVRDLLPEKPSAISFAFPGPADYEAGVIGDLPNFPAFRGGVALGPFLKARFQIPVFINNDGNLFAYGEATEGILPAINKELLATGSSKCYRNLLGITLGTGFGAGVVIDGKLLVGDNGAGGDMWCFRNKRYPDCIAEESVSIRAVKRVYTSLSGDNSNLTPKDIFEIAEGTRSGNQKAAIFSFEELGEMAGNAIAEAITLIDGLVVIGGGLAGAGKYILPALVRELKEPLQMMNGTCFARLQMEPFNLEDPADRKKFLEKQCKQIRIPGTEQYVDYDPYKRIGVAISQLGANRAIALGAYKFALNKLNEQ